MTDEKDSDEQTQYGGDEGESVERETADEEEDDEEE